MFTELVRAYGPTMLRVAMLYVASRAVAEEVVQEAWLGVLAGLDRFQGRSSFKTWLFRILTNIAKTRGQREGRTIPFSALAGEDEDGSPAVDPERFHPPGSTWEGHWLAGGAPAAPEERLLAREARERVAAAIEQLPAAQRAVITLRDVSALQCRGGVRAARDLGGQPACAPAPCPHEGAERARVLSGGGGAVTFPADITCREIVELVTDYLEGALDPAEIEAVEMHLSYCDGCVDYLDQMRNAIRVTGRLTEETLPPALERELVRAFSGLRRRCSHTSSCEPEVSRRSPAFAGGRAHGSRPGPGRSPCAGAASTRAAPTSCRSG